MSLDLQTIGVAFDTSGLEKGAAALGQTAQAAGTAATAADRAAGSLGKLGAAAGSGAEGSKRFSDGLGGLGGSTDSANQKTLAFIASLERQVALYGASASEAARYDASLMKMSDAQRQHTGELLKSQAAQEKAAGSTSWLASSIKMLGAAWAGVRLVDWVRDTLLLAARFETLGVVMRVAGNNAGYTMAQMEGFSKSLQQTGISMLESRNATIQLATANIDLSRAQGLARAAQDLAVVGQTNSSDALARMIHGIKSGEVEILRSLGLNVNFEASYKKLADSLGISTEALDENQKMLARTNAVMDESVRYAGIYEEAMTTVGKAMTSLTRYVEDLRTKMGGTMLPSLAVSVDLVTRAIKAASAAMGDGEGAAQLFAKGLDGALSFGLKAGAVLAMAAATAFKILTIEVGAAAAMFEHLLRGNWGKVNDIAQEAAKQVKEAWAGNKAFVTEMLSGEKQVQAAKAATVQMSEAQRIASAQAAKAEAQAATQRSAEKNAMQDFLKQFGTEAQKAQFAVDEWKAKLGSLFSPELEKKIRESFGGKGAADAARQANALIEASLAARMEKAKEAANAEQRLAQSTVAEITHLRKMGALGEIEAIELIAGAEIKALWAAEEAARTRADLEAQRPKNKLPGGKIDNSAVLAAQAEVVKAEEAVAARRTAMENAVTEALKKDADEQIQKRRDAATAAVLAYLAIGQAQRQARETQAEQNELVAYELALMGQGEAARQTQLASLRAVLALKKELQAIDDNPKLDDPAKANLRVGAMNNFVDAQATAGMQEQINLMKQLDASLDPNKAQTFGEALRDAFQGAANSLVGMVNALDNYAAMQAQIADDQAKIEKLDNPEDKARAQLKLAEKIAKVQVQSYGDMASAAKGFFKQGTTGYKALEAAEKAYRLYELSSRALAFATKMGWISKEVVTTVAADAAKTESAVAGAGVEVGATMTVANANAVAGVANQAKGDPYSAFARMAAMAAIMAAMGLAVGGGGGPSLPEERQAEQGTGTVFGDSSAKSKSITNSLEMLAGNSNIALKFNSEMLMALRSIDNGVATMAGTVASTAGLRGTSLDAINAGVGSYKGFGGYRKTSTTLLDQGLYLPYQALGTIMASGIRAFSYTTTRTESSNMWGLFGTSTSTNWMPANLDAELKSVLTSTIVGMADAVKLAAVEFGYSGDVVTQQLQNFQIKLGQISLNGLDAEQIQAELSAVFGKLGDQMAKLVVPGLESFQQVGEGYFETAVRVAAATEDAAYQLERFGVAAVDIWQVTQRRGDLGAEIVRASILRVEQAGSGLSQMVATLGGTAEEIATTYSALRDLRDGLKFVGLSADALSRDLVRGGRGLEGLQSGLDAFFENYFTDTEKAAAQTAKMAQQFHQIGLAMPDDRDGFRALVEGIDTTTASGQLLLGQVLALAEGFAETTQAAEAAINSLASLQDEMRRLQIELLGALGQPDAQRAAQREVDTADFSDAQKALYDYNQRLRDQIAMAKQASELERRVAEATGGVAAVRALDLSRTAAVLRPMQELLWLREDEAKLIGQRVAMEKRLLQAQGNTTELRARELAALDASLRGMQENIWALEDQAKAREKASAALDAAYRQEAQALQKKMDDLQTSANSLREFSKSLREFRDSLTLGAMSPLTPGQKYRNAATLFEDTYQQALGGDQAAMGRMQQTADDFLTASQRYLASSPAYQVDFARVQAALTLTAASADAQASAAEQQIALGQAQLDELKSTVGALIQIEQAVLSVADAIAQLTQASAPIAPYVPPAPVDTSEAYTAALAELAAVMAQVTAPLVMPEGSSALGFHDTWTPPPAPQDQASAGWWGLLQGITSSFWSLTQGTTTTAPSITLPGYAEGTDYVPVTGPALLHQGEAVMPAGVVAQATRSQAGAGSAELAQRLDTIAAEVRRLGEASAAQTRALIAAHYDASERAADTIVEGGGRSRFQSSQAQRAGELA